MLRYYGLYKIIYSVKLIWKPSFPFAKNVQKYKKWKKGVKKMWFLLHKLSHNICVIYSHHFHSQYFPIKSYNIFSHKKKHFIWRVFRNSQKWTFLKMSKNENLNNFLKKKRKNIEKWKWDHNALNCKMEKTVCDDKIFYKKRKSSLKIASFLDIFWDIFRVSFCEKMSKNTKNEKRGQENTIFTA